MTITYRGVGTAGGAATTSGSIPVPSGTLAGDVLFATVALTIDTSNTLISFPGWTKFASSPVSMSGFTVVYWLWKVAGGSAGNATTDTATAFSWTTSCAWTVVSAAYGGVDTTTPINGAASQAFPSNLQTQTTPSLAPTTGTTWGVAVWTTRAANAAPGGTPTSSLTNRANYCPQSSPWEAIAWSDTNGYASAASQSYGITYATTESRGADALFFINAAASSPGLAVQVYNGSAWTAASEGFYNGSAWTSVVAIK